LFFFPTEIAVYLGSVTRKCHGYCGSSSAAVAARTEQPRQGSFQVQWSDGHSTFTQTPVVKHWLPIHERITYKVAILTYKIRAYSTPSYLSDLLHPVTSRSSRSVDTRRLQTQRTLTELGRRAFSLAAPTVWNSLPAQQRLSGSLPTFKKHLKTLLFTSAF